MRATVLEAPQESERAYIWFGLALSILLHAALAASTRRIPTEAAERPIWIEMEVNTTEAEPEPIIEPVPIIEPEPEPIIEPVPIVEPEPEPIDFKETVKAPPPEPTPVKKKPVRRLTQGINANSFLPGANTGLAVRAGTTTSVRAGKNTLKIEEADEFEGLAFAAVSVAPKITRRPLLTIPQSLIDQHIEGRVQVLLTIDLRGTVVHVKIMSGLTPDADAACVADLKRTRWHPAQTNGRPTPVRGVPYSCRYKASQ